MKNMTVLGYCEQCGVQLTDVTDARRGHCPTHWAQLCLKWKNTDLRHDPEYGKWLGIIPWRGGPMHASVLVRAAGKVPAMVTNVPWSVAHHSLTGWEWGYGGSGPADFALNVLNWYIPPGSDGYEAVPCFEGYASYTAWRLHQPFKFAFIGRLMRGADVLLFEDKVRPWLEDKQLLLAARDGIT